MSPVLPKLSIIVVSHNGLSYLQRTLQSVREETQRSSTVCQTQVILVDANSTDDTPVTAAKAFPEVDVHRVVKPIGFSAANNLGVEYADGEYVLFLNPDTELQPGALAALLQPLLLDTQEKIGAVSGQLLNPDQTIQPQGGSLPNLGNLAAWMWFIDDLPVLKNWISAYQQRQPRYFLADRATGWIGGTAFCMRRSLFLELGGWDERIFLYGEDVEFCLRIAQAGKQIQLVSEAKIVHYQHKTTGGATASILGEMEGLVYIWRKHYSRWPLSLLKTLLYTGVASRVLLFGILGRDHTRRQAYLQAFTRIRLA